MATFTNTDKNTTSGTLIVSSGTTPTFTNVDKNSVSATPFSVESNLLLETGDNILLESGSIILLDGLFTHTSTLATFTNLSKS